LYYFIIILLPLSDIALSALRAGCVVLLACFVRCLPARRAGWTTKKRVCRKDRTVGTSFSGERNLSSI
jgi:hypothetical protein